MNRPPVWAQHGMVACGQPLAGQAGLHILRQGGTAVDAAIATNACLGLMEPTACGLGGDLFAIVWDPKAMELSGLNASGRAPRRLTIDKVEPAADGTIPLHSPYSWSVPGCADGWAELHARFGRIPMAELLAPAIEYARGGFPVSPRISRLWAGVAPSHASFPGFGEVYLPGGRAPREGELFRNPALARTLSVLATEGREAYYSGPIADALVAYSDTNGGFFSNEDFSGHRSTWDTPMPADYRGYTVWEMPPNSQGIAALQLLNILELFDVRSMGRDSADFWHLAIEAKKLVYGDRARHYCDPAFSETPIDWLISKEYARERAKLIDMARAARLDSAGEPVVINRPETTYLCTADGEGMMVSLIQSNYTGFGSGYVVPELGFGLQDRGGLFSLDPGHANALVPGKRPFQTIIPAFVTRDGEPWMAFGLMGGDMQPQGHAQVLMNLVDFDMDVQQAGDAIRFHHIGSSEPTGTVMTDGGIVHIEDGLAEDVLTELRRRGHVLEWAPAASYGGYQAILRHLDSGVYAGATESRKDGAAIGY